MQETVASTSGTFLMVVRRRGLLESAAGCRMRRRGCVRAWWCPPSGIPAREVGIRRWPDEGFERQGGMRKPNLPDATLTFAQSLLRLGIGSRWQYSKLVGN